MASDAATGLRLRDMTAEDLAAAHALSREVRWPHRLEDWELMFRVGLGVVAESDAGVVGTVMGFPYGSTMATLGMVIVSGDLRSQGLGRRLMEEMMRRLAPRTIQLNATESGLALYKSLGFRTVGSIHQHQGAAFSPPMAKLRKGERVRPVSASELAAIAELDRRATGFERPELLRLVQKQAQGVVLDRGGVAAGFALFRRFGHGYVVGPVVAPDRDGARTLIAHWLGSQAGMFIRVDVPGDSGLGDWLQDLGLEEVDRVVTMRRGEDPPTSEDAAAYAVVSQALG